MDVVQIELKNNYYILFRPVDSRREFIILFRRVEERIYDDFTFDASRRMSP